MVFNYVYIRASKSFSIFYSMKKFQHSFNTNCTSHFLIFKLNSFHVQSQIVIIKSRDKVTTPNRYGFMDLVYLHVT